MSDSVTLYRVSSRYDGKGPFNTRDPHYDYDHRGAGRNGHPLPEGEGIRSRARAQFACPSRGHFYRWWSLSWRRKWKLAFQLEVITIDPAHVSFGRTQCVYDPAYATVTIRPLEASLHA